MEWCTYCAVKLEIQRNACAVITGRRSYHSVTSESVNRKILLNGEKSQTLQSAIYPLLVKQEAYDLSLIIQWEVLVFVAEATKPVRHGT